MRPSIHLMLSLPGFACLALHAPQSLGTLYRWPDKTDQLKQSYLGNKPVTLESSGSLTWHHNQIRLFGKEPLRYQKNGEPVVPLKSTGKPMVNHLASRYVVHQVADSLGGKSWTLTHVLGQPVEPAPKGRREPNLSFAAGANRVAGYFGCNNVLGRYELMANHRIRFTQLVTTQKACLDMRLEKQMLAMLTKADSYSLKADTLSLNRSRMVPLARFVAMPKH